MLEEKQNIGYYAIIPAAVLYIDEFMPNQKIIYAVIIFVVSSKQRFQLDNMHIIISFTQRPITVRYSVDGTYNIFVFIKWAGFCSCLFYCVPQFGS